MLSVIIEEKSVIHGLIKAKKAYVEEKAKVEDIIAEYVELDDKVQTRNIKADTIIIGDKCRILGKIEYTKELIVGENVYFAEKPVKK